MVLGCGLLCILIFTEGAPWFLVFPSTKTIANRYLGAVVDADLGAAKDLASHLDNCAVATIEQAQEDIAILGWAEIRSVAVELWASTGSTEEIEGARIALEYGSSTEEEWQPYMVDVMTYYKFPGRRGACGGSP
jgi:hypothetical protein